LPHLFVEPGRSLIARAGVALYTVGSRKDVEGLRTWVSVDGGMADNIRPAMYDARYEAVVVNRADEDPVETVAIAGKYCESGDVLVKEAHLPRTEPGDVIALPASGAYHLAMSSNYNMSPRPAVVVVKGGQAKIIRRRETYGDLLATDVFGE
jgi:diaminopimelate decarboxylase